MNTTTVLPHGTAVAALERALRAPSVHNTQPWRWRITDGAVELWADRSRHLVGTDPDQLDLVISCGAALHHLCAALAAAGVATTVERLPDADRGDLLAVVHGSPGAPDADEAALAASIENRRTDRRAFVTAAEAAELRRLAATAARHGARLYPVPGLTHRARLRAILGDAAARQRYADGYPAELAIWTGRFAGARDGVPAQQRTRSAAADSLRAFPAGHLNAPAPGGPDTESDTLAVLATPADHRADRLRAGEAGSAVLLAATRMGLASTPLSQAMEVEQTRRAVAHLVSSHGDVPQLVLRFGRPAIGADELPATPRRPLGWVLRADAPGDAR